MRQSCWHQPSLWSIILAGGQGMRLRRLVRRIHGEERPKQFAMVTSGRSLLRETLERTSALAPAERTVIVTRADHVQYLEEQGRERTSAPHVLPQPADRGTAAGVLLPAQWIHAHDPDALVAVFPSDHLVVEGRRFIAHVAEVAAAVRTNPDWVVLLGAQADWPETEYGWIEPDRVCGSTSSGPISTVARFWEKPGPTVAKTLLARGCLWNTFVIVATSRRLLELGERHVPELSARLAQLHQFFGTPHERWALGQAYASAPSANFSRDVLEPGQAELMVARMPELTWSDLGTPQRVFRAVRELGLRPPWLGARRVWREQRASA
jgi:mannose-1-phosphate guanylyltransferase